MTDKRIVLTTAGSEGEAGKIAESLVERRLAACVNIVPRIRSVYRWREKVESAEEWLMMIKTDEAHLAEVREAIRALHSYELPECIVLNIEDGSPEYLNWLEESVK
jgi:periplasmic divalent cation tolerance protein